MTKRELMEKSAKELKEMAKTAKVKNWWTLKKAELVDALAVEEATETRIAETAKCIFVLEKFGTAWYKTQLADTIADKFGIKSLVVKTPDGKRVALFGAESKATEAHKLFEEAFYAMEHRGYAHYRKEFNEGREHEGVKQSFMAGFIEAIKTTLKKAKKVKAEGELEYEAVDKFNGGKEEFPMKDIFYNVGYEEAVAFINR